MQQWTQSQYADVLQEKKQTAHDNMILYIDVNARELMEECEPGAKNLDSCCKAMTEAMLEGDDYLVEPKIKTKIAGKLTIRYFVDNLREDRRPLSEILVNS